MASLILHVGPAKCGSSSIQHFLADQKKPCIQNTYFTILNQQEIEDLNCENPSADILKTFSQKLLKNLSEFEVIILSNEYLFQCHYAIKNICLLAKNLVPRISIIGYSRRQSDFLVSAYCQWSFRSLKRIKEVLEVIESLKIDSNLFSGLEREIIASIITDFYNPTIFGFRFFDWYNSYRTISQLVDNLYVMVKCGVLPEKEKSNELIHDFCQKSDLILRDSARSANRQIVNASFNQDIIEAINIAASLGLDMPSHHEKNEILSFLSSKANQIEKSSSQFLFYLKSYIDSYFSNSNRKFCQEFNLNETYFMPNMQLNRHEILDIIILEGQQRAADKSIVIDKYRRLSAGMIELCLKIVRDSGYIE